jgi:hypothetical protein
MVKIMKMNKKRVNHTVKDIIIIIIILTTLIVIVIILNIISQLMNAWTS